MPEPTVSGMPASRAEAGSPAIGAARGRGRRRAAGGRSRCGAAPALDARAVRADNGRVDIERAGDANERPSTVPSDAPGQVARARVTREGRPRRLGWSGAPMPAAWEGTSRARAYRAAARQRAALERFDVVPGPYASRGRRIARALLLLEAAGVPASAVAEVARAVGA